MKDLLTVREVAEILRVTRVHLYKLVSKKRIPHLKMPGVGVRFDREILEAWIEEGEVKPT